MHRTEAFWHIQPGAKEFTVLSNTFSWWCMGWQPAQMQDQMMQGGLTDLWLDDPYVLAAKKLIQWATEENEAGEVFPVSMLSPCPCCTCSYAEAFPSVRATLSTQACNNASLWVDGLCLCNVCLTSWRNSPKCRMCGLIGWIAPLHHILCHSVISCHVWNTDVLHDSSSPPSQPMPCLMRTLVFLSDVLSDSSLAWNGLNENLPCKNKLCWVQSVELGDHIEMRKTDCFGKTRLVLHVPSSSCAGKPYYYYYCYCDYYHYY